MTDEAQVIESLRKQLLSNLIAEVSVPEGRRLLMRGPSSIGITCPSMQNPFIFKPDVISASAINRSVIINPGAVNVFIVVGDKPYLQADANPELQRQYQQALQYAARYQRPLIPGATDIESRLTEFFDMPIEPISEVHTAPIVLGLEHEQAIADLMRGRSLNAQSLSELVVRRSVSEEWLQQTGGLRTLLQLGRNSAKYNHYGDAAQHYISCLRILPREETIWENIIVALRHLPERDIKYYVITQLANISPDDAATWKKKAELAELLNLHRAAVAFYKQALDCNASDWHALDKVSSLLLRIGTPRFVQKPAPQPQYVPNAKPAPPPYAPAIPIAPAPPAAREEKTEEKPVDILQCPECGVTVGESDTKCPRCGAESEYGGGEEKPAAAPSQQEDWQNMERAVDKATYEALHCQTCGAFTNTDDGCTKCSNIKKV